MFNSLRCGWPAAIFALCLTGCAELLEGDLAAGLLPAAYQAPGALVLWQGGRSQAQEG